MKKSGSTHYTIRELQNMYVRQELLGTCRYQRPYEWTKRQLAELQLSYIGGYDVNRLVANKKQKDGNPVFYLLDGKNRFLSTMLYTIDKSKPIRLPHGSHIHVGDLTFNEFDSAFNDISDKMEAKEIKEQDILVDKNGDTSSYTEKDVLETLKQGENDNENMIRENCYLNLSGFSFANLPKIFQEKILNTSIEIQYYDNLLPWQEKEIVAKNNNGSSLTSADRTKINSISTDVLNALSQHTIFQNKEKMGLKVVTQICTVLFFEKPELSQRYMDKALANRKITNEEMDMISHLLDVAEDIYSHLIDIGAKQQARNIIKQIHLVSIMPLLKEVDEQDVDTNQKMKLLYGWAAYFFAGNKKAASISDDYNQAALRNTSREVAVSTRINCVKKSFTNFVEQQK
jgi:hypothetical protein